MNQKIRYAEDRILAVFPDSDVGHGAVLLRHNAVDRQRDRCPLIFLHTAIVMRIKKCHFRILIQRHLLEIQPRRINVRTQDAKSLFDRFRSDGKQCYCLLHPDRVDLVAALQGFAPGNDLIQITPACLAGTLCDLHHRLALCLRSIQKILVIFCKRMQILQLFLRVRCPSVFFSH